MNFREGDGQNQLLGNSWAEKVAMLGMDESTCQYDTRLLASHSASILYNAHHKTFRKGPGPRVMPH